VVVDPLVVVVVVCDRVMTCQVVLGSWVVGAEVEVGARRACVETGRRADRRDGVDDSLRELDTTAVVTLLVVVAGSVNVTTGSLVVVVVPVASTTAGPPTDTSPTLASVAPPATDKPRTTASAHPLRTGASCAPHCVSTDKG
jgi:hypothetical protein